MQQSDVMERYIRWGERYANDPEQWIAVVIGDFLVYVLGHTRIGSLETCDAYRKVLQHFAAWIMAQGIAEPFTRRTFEEYVAAVKWNIKNQTLRNRISILCHLGKWLLREGHATADPAAGLELPPARTTPGQAISPADQKRVLAAARQAGIHILAPVLFLRDTGCRAGEIVGLVWGRLDIAQRSARVTGKGGRERIVIFSTETAHVLSRWRKQACSSPDAFVFWGRTRQPLRQARNLERLLTYLGRLAQVQGPVNPHSWRHQYVTQLVKSGMPKIAIDRLVGHDSGNVTQRYTHLSVDELRALYDKYAPWAQTPILARLRRFSGGS